MFPCTNNIAEYEVLVIGIKMALEWNITELQVYGDSQLIINQVNDEYNPKDEKLMPYKAMIDAWKNYFALITFEKIPREKNRSANVMATLASFLQKPNQNEKYKFLVEELAQPTFDLPETQIVSLLHGHDSPCYDTIYTYLKDQVLPLDQS